MQKYRKLQLADFFLQLYHKLLESATYSSAGDSERIVNHGSSRSHGDKKQEKVGKIINKQT